MFLGIEDAGYALHLYLDMIDKALPHGQVADGAVARDITAAAVSDKDYLAVLLQG